MSNNNNIPHNDNTPSFFFSNNISPNSLSSNENLSSIHSLLQIISNRQIEILDRIQNIENNLQNTANPNSLSFPILGRRTRQSNSFISSIDLTSEENNENNKRFRPNSSLIDNPRSININTNRNSNVQLFTFPSIQTNEPNTNIWNLNIISDENDFTNDCINNKSRIYNDHYNIVNIQVKVTLPIQQIELLPTIKTEIAKRTNHEWNDFNVFLKTINKLSTEDQLMEIQNNSTLLVRKKKEKRKPYNIRIILPDDEYLTIQIDNNDYIWEIKYIIFLKNNSFPPIKQRLIFGGQQLEDNKFIHNYEIKEDFVIHLVKKLG